jgi:hypothetical protein
VVLSKAGAGRSLIFRKPDPDGTGFASARRKNDNAGTKRVVNSQSTPV